MSRHYIYIYEVKYFWKDSGIQCSLPIMLCITWEVPSGSEYYSDGDMKDGYDRERELFCKKPGLETEQIILNKTIRKEKDTRIKRIRVML